MTVSAEELFDAIGQQYEDVYAENPGLEEVIQLALAELKPKSQVLDVGCGTGKPVASDIARAGHNVYGIDVSQKMVDIAREQVHGQFEKADMLAFEPTTRFSAIFAIFSLFQLSHVDTYSMMFKFSDWLQKSGILVLGTIPSTSLIKDRSLYDSTGQIVRHAELPFMGQRQLTTLYSMDGWRTLLQKAGFDIKVERFFSFTAKQPFKDEIQKHYFIIAKKTVDHALMGPYPLPTSYRGPHPLCEGSWAPFAERLVRDEFDAVLDLLKNNANALDVGSGYGKLPMAVAQRGGKAYSIESNAERNSLQVQKEQNVEIRVGSAENIPFPDGNFDAVVAMWVMHYVDDLEASLQEMARVADINNPNARLIVVQGAPDNQVVNLLNDVCVPLSRENTRDHQGYLLYTAAKVFSERGFGQIETFRVNAFCAFPEKDMMERCTKAAEVLVGLWFKEDPNYAKMTEALIPHLELHFRDREHAIGNEAVILMARPFLSS
ncbi:hypothetical protein CNMCM6936_005174 [Aspergillus lentulus]|uniref:Methyltransferase type 11 domain-containing protein n=1 Tax=Aspergillus lentulus TaxID=293939 RepID=A0AAN6BSN5_ASPLE|nr:hypothetical protein CNMCM6936_005174 [Aspergillus lentulus]KAF4181850.1 hypothetical protein CNMCM8060_008221 [Aspergillus lentulus]KAF4189800.1 hypothetical protein CNMCM7927_006584 [Aspergillus lentulus]KAF4198106.1 hypothetical protein CNMCM8694_000790 [Aspergillus lentulus]KAF4208845.1 hypothetical protein CNMCM8927_008794 [Aspergillus lentulus]